jgi:hypothetical protein
VWPDEDLNQEDDSVRIKVEEESSEESQREIYRQSLVSGATPGSIKLSRRKHEIGNQGDSDYVTAKDPLSRFLIWMFAPVFDELAAGLMAFLCGLLYWFDLRHYPGIIEFWRLETQVMLIVSAVYLYFSFIAIYHVFSDVPKTPVVKKTLAVLSGICSTFSGIMGGYYLYLYGPHSLLQLFGVWNMIQGVALLLLLSSGHLDHRNLTDRDTPFAGAVINFGIVALLYFFLKIFTSLHWVDFFAICVAYIITFSSFICDQVSPPPLNLPSQKKSLSATSER